MRRHGRMVPGFAARRARQGRASAERLERIEQALSRGIDGGKLPGAVIMVARDGQLAYTKTIGFRDKDANVLWPRDSIFRIYSMTKPLVSVAAMMKRRCRGGTAPRRLLCAP